MSETDPAELESRLRGLVRRELFVLDVDPRSPERGQYVFVQALIREVAYNTLAKRDRKLRHLAAARYFEQLGTDELAGGLAGHYLAAQRLAADPAEADALAAQARVALRAAAERAVALGSHEQAITFLEQALGITPDPAERARLHGAVSSSARQVLDGERAIHSAEAAVAELRTTGDREAIALAVARQGRAIANAFANPARSLEVLMAAWTEFADLEETPAGVELMSAIASCYTGLARGTEALPWTDRCLPVAERLGLLEQTARTMNTRASALLMQGRSWEGQAALRGAHQLALTNDIQDVELVARILITFGAQWGDPAAGLAFAREGLEIGRRLGSRNYGHQMIGNGSVCALRVGEWDWAAEQLDEWLAIDSDWGARSEFYMDRAVLRSLRGQDGSADLDEALQILREGEITDPQWESYTQWARAWAAFAAGRFDEARDGAERAVALTGYFSPFAHPLGIRAALHAGDATGAARLLAALEISGFRGSALAADRLAVRAGLDALEGRGPAALAGYREAIRMYRQLGLAFDEALAVVDMAALLQPPERDQPDVLTAIEVARDTLRRLEAHPLLERLERAEAAAPTG